MVVDCLKNTFIKRKIICLIALLFISIFGWVLLSGRIKNIVKEVDIK